MICNETVKRMAQYIEQRKARSAWDKGVKAYALELCESLDDALEFYGNLDLRSGGTLRTTLLNGAEDWREYSRGGCSLIYNKDIAKRLCTPSELRKTENGAKMPNAREDWLDVQARALYWAFRLVSDAFYDE